MAEEIVAAGGLLPDEIMLKVVTSKLDLLHNKVGRSPLCMLSQYPSRSDFCVISTGSLTGFHEPLARANFLTTISGVFIRFILVFWTVLNYLSRRHRNSPLSLVVNLDVADEIILSRISDRWVHLPSGRVYNLSYNPPKVPGRDDETGEALTKRPDDNPVSHDNTPETPPTSTYFWQPCFAGNLCTSS